MEKFIDILYFIFLFRLFLVYVTATNKEYAIESIKCWFNIIFHRVNAPLKCAAKKNLLGKSI